VPYKSLMVHLGLERSNDSRLQIAADLAERLDAHLIGIAAADPNPPAYGGGSLALGLVAEGRHAIERQLADAEARFRSAVRGRPDRIEWRQALEKPNPFIARQARAADVIITGMGTSGALVDPFRVLDPGALLIEAGRPVLFVTPKADAVFARRILVGWKDTREARRAIWDALPLLQAADYVVVVSITERGDQAPMQAQIDDVVTWLKRHGIAAVARVVRGDSAANLLPELAADELADLIVTGAYGHSRMREWMWGGVTRSLLTSSPCSCLLSH
jgi:nucleotide-binding universal stress UspA family protein